MCISVPLDLEKKNSITHFHVLISMLYIKKCQLNSKESIAVYACTNWMVIASIWHTEDNLMQIVAMINNNFKDSKCHIFKGAPPILKL